MTLGSQGRCDSWPLGPVGPMTHCFDMLFQDSDCKINVRNVDIMNCDMLS